MLGKFEKKNAFFCTVSSYLSESKMSYSELEHTFFFNGSGAARLISFNFFPQ